MKELQQTEENLENFKRELNRLAEEINTIPLNSERGIKAKQFFEEGDFQAAREILDAKEMNREQQALLYRQLRLAQQQETIVTQLNDLAGEFMLKAQLTAIDYQLGNQRIPLASQYFEQALESGKTPERLFDYALFLQKNNQFVKAEKRYQEALTILRELAQNNPAVYLRDVATTLNNLGLLVVADSSRREEAEKHYQEALKTYRQLAQNNPAYLPDVAMTLNNLGNLVADDSRHEEAEKRYQEALKTYRQLAQNNPAVYLPYVAITLNNLGLLVAADSSRREEAEKRYQEALTIRRQLVQNNPAHLPDVAVTLHNMGLLAADDSSRREEAEKRYQEALTIRRQLAQNNPAVYLPDVANTLSAYGSAHLSWQQPKKAIIYLKEAEEIFTIFAAQALQVFKRKLDLIQHLLQQASETDQN